MHSFNKSNHCASTVRSTSHTAQCLLSLIILHALVLCYSDAAVSSDSDGWTSLFDGTTLNGWVQKGDYKEAFRVESGEIVGPNARASFLCTTQEYADFILELEVKIPFEMNSGVQVRSHCFDTETKVNWQGKEISIPAQRVHGYQIEVDPSERAWTGGFYDEGRRGWLQDLVNNEPARKAFKSGEWNKMRIECRADTFKTWVNGVPAAYAKDGMTQSGFIGLQAHGNPTTNPSLSVRFRNLRLKKIGEFGDKKDKSGEVQRLLVPRELIPSAAPRTAQEELKSFQVAPGFRVELVAGDPLVQDPVAMQIGPDGRIWVVELRGFMADLDGVKEAEPVGDVVVLEDTDGDGIMDKRTVFQAGLVMPRALMLVGDGVLIGAPPHLWFCRDNNGDGVADEKQELANNFGMQSDPMRPEVANPEQAPNSLLWGSDNWIYAAHWTRKFRFSGGQWTSGNATFRGQWGLSQDNDGRLFYNSNQDPLRVDILPSHYTGRNPNHPRCEGVNVQVYSDQLVWPTRVNPGVNRGYRDGILRENYRLKEFTAACAPCIYRGGLFPAEFDGNAFICEPAGNLIKREIITEKNGTMVCKEAYDQHEFLASTDERFRPVNLYTGPDGALYVTDLYHGVLQHRESFTTYLRQYIEERGLDNPQHLGRIWRVVPESKSLGVKPQLHRQNPAQWVAHLSHTNSWWRETAQRLLVERNDTAVVPALQAVALHGESALGRMHALWTLDGMNRLEPDIALAALKDDSTHVRAAAVRVCEGFLKREHRAKVLPHLIAMINESAPLVQQQLVLTLSEDADKLTDHAIAELVRKAASTAFIQDAALSGLAGRELDLLAHLLTQKGSPSPENFLSALARCVFGARNSTQVEQLLGLLVSHPEYEKVLVAGILETKATITGKKPVKFLGEPAVLKQLNSSAIAALITWPGKPGAKPEPPIIQLTNTQQARYESGKILFSGVCAACHRPHGLGLEGVAPPLVDSEWVLGSEQRLGRILLHGLTGPLSVKGRSYRLDMPAFGMFSDEQIAGILTYIRGEWEHNATPVEPDTIKAIRATTMGRREAWLQEELQKVR